MNGTKLSIIAGVAAAATSAILALCFEGNAGGDLREVMGWIAWVLLLPALFAGDLVGPAAAPVVIPAVGFLQYFCLYG
jgi:hypothetical protein